MNGRETGSKGWRGIGFLLPLLPLLLSPLACEREKRHRYTSTPTVYEFHISWPALPKKQNLGDFVTNRYADPILK